MGDKTGIQWTDATWNPVVGCSVISPGCKRCYAMEQAARIERMTPGTHYAGTTQMTKGGAVWTGKVVAAPDHILFQPMRWKRPRTIFVNSMSDLFHEDIPDSTIDRVFAVMALCPQHRFQVLTKRTARMRSYMAAVSLSRLNAACSSLAANVASVPAVWPLPNVWLGVSCEDQKHADQRIPDLLATPAAVRFISAEPLLGPVDLTRISAPEKVEGEDWVFDALIRGDTYYQRIERLLDPPVYDVGDGPHRDAALDWVIVGGESGKDARPMKLNWARDIITQCRAAGVPCFVKQLGSATGFNLHHRKGGDPMEWAADLRVREMPA